MWSWCCVIAAETAAKSFSTRSRLLETPCWWWSAKKLKKMLIACRFFLESFSARVRKLTRQHCEPWETLLVLTWRN